LRYNAKLDLGGDWKLGFLLEVPIVEKTTSSFAPPSASRDAGLGGTFTQAALIKTINQNRAYGFGARVVAPGQDMLPRRPRHFLPPLVRRRGPTPSWIGGASSSATPTDWRSRTSISRNLTGKVFRKPS
jgi:hypothetical protein